MTETLLQIEGLQTYYGKIHALKGISLAVRQGQIVTLLGANGAGKSTTLRTISGLIRATEGRITFQGQDITTAPPTPSSAWGSSTRRKAGASSKA